MTQELIDAPAPTQSQEIAKAPGDDYGTAMQRSASRVSDDGEFANLLDVSRFEHVQRIANLFASSQLVPAHFQGNIANCFIALQMAMRMKVDPFMFMQNTYIVHGRPGMEAKLAIALINSSGLFTDSLDYEIEGTDPKAANYRVRAFAVRKSTGRRVDGPWVDWAIVRAEQWHSKNGSKWQTIPGLMFQYRAATFFGRLHCPERLMGMQTVDELRDTGELKPIESGAIGNNSTAPSRLLSRITSKPVSEGQKFEPAPEALAQAESDVTAQLQAGATTEAAPEPDVPPAEEAIETGPPPKPVPMPVHLTSHELLTAAIDGAAQDLGVTPSASAAWILKTLDTRGIKDVAKQAPKVRYSIFEQFVRDHGGAIAAG